MAIGDHECVLGPGGRFQVQLAAIMPAGNHFWVAVLHAKFFVLTLAYHPHLFSVRAEIRSSFDAPEALRPVLHCRKSERQKTKYNGIFHDQPPVPLLRRNDFVCKPSIQQICC